MTHELDPYREGMDPYRPPRPHAPRIGWGTMIALWAIVFLLVWRLINPTGVAPLHDPNAKPRAVTARGDLSSDEKATIEIFREASPSVVNITVMELRRMLFSRDVFAIPRGTGSGVVYDREGHVITNFHVSGENTQLVVRLADQSEWTARRVGSVLEKDLAVLKIDAPPDKLKPIAIGASADLQVGQKVFAIGNPFGLDQTLTTGVISALYREIKSVAKRPIQGVIQTDAAINPGNSGGPLLDSAGRLIGINTQIASLSGSSSGIGFAVPVDVVRRVVPQLIQRGTVKRPGLGVNVYPDDVVRKAGIQRGVLIQHVHPGSAAEKAGLRGTVFGNHQTRLGDIILKVNDDEVNGQFQLLDLFEQYEVGNEVRITFQRDDRLMQTTVRLQPVDAS